MADDIFLNILEREVADRHSGKALTQSVTVSWSVAMFCAIGLLQFTGDRGALAHSEKHQDRQVIIARIEPQRVIGEPWAVSCRAFRSPISNRRQYPQRRSTPPVV